MSSLKQAKNIFAAVRKNGRQKLFWTGIDRGGNQCFSGRVVDPEVFNKTIILLGLTGYKMIMTLMNACSHRSNHNRKAELIAMTHL